MPGLFKITTVRKPATKARKGINPFTKEEVMFKAKPARTVIKIRPLKKLKDMDLTQRACLQKDARDGSEDRFNFPSVDGTELVGAEAPGRRQTLDLLRQRPFGRRASKPRTCGWCRAALKFQFFSRSIIHEIHD